MKTKNKYKTWRVHIYITQQALCYCAGNMNVTWSLSSRSFQYNSGGRLTTVQLSKCYHKSEHTDSESPEVGMLKPDSEFREFLELTLKKII